MPPLFYVPILKPITHNTSPNTALRSAYIMRKILRQAKLGSKHEVTSGSCASLNLRR